jgi:hypothetical protein
MVFVAHPIQDRTDDEMRALADEALEEIVYEGARKFKRKEDLIEMAAKAIGYVWNEDDQLWRPAP